MVERKKQLPIFGVGPLYVGGCFLVTALGLLLKSKGLLRFGDLRRGQKRDKSEKNHKKIEVSC